MKGHAMQSNEIQYNIIPNNTIKYNTILCNITTRPEQLEYTSWEVFREIARRPP